jgi:hypothetical protein
MRHVRAFAVSCAGVAIVAGGLAGTGGGAGSESGASVQVGTVAVAAPLTPPVSGVPAGTVLKPTGSLRITKAGTVVQNADVRGGISVEAADVVIRNTRVTGSSWGDGLRVRRGSARIERTTVRGFENGVTGDNYTADRVEVTAVASDGFKIGSNVLIRSSWCHDPKVAPGAHADCGQVQSGVRNAVVEGSWFDVGRSGNAALFLAPDLGPSSAGPLVVRDNTLGGGNFTVFCVDGNDGEYFIRDITIARNRFLGTAQYGDLRVNVPVAISGNVNIVTKRPVTG